MFQLIENFPFWTGMSYKLVNKKLNGDSRVNKTVNDHNTIFQETERVDNIVNNNLSSSPI